MRSDTRIVITDSGLGGLSICAAIEKNLRAARLPRAVRLTYVNAWPFEDRGYNDLPDAAARADVFDRALSCMHAMDPDRILIACNTLSIVYRQTAFSRNPPVPVQGIVDAGVDLFLDRLTGDPGASIVLTGTTTTVESGVHRHELVRRGIDPARIAAVSCHGLAAAIERDVDGPLTARFIDACTSRAAEAAPPGGVLFAGLCCTHYGYVALRIVDALARKTGRRVRALDPNLRLVGNLMTEDGFLEGAQGQELEAGHPCAASPCGDVTVEVISRVGLDDAACRGIARLIEPVSPVTSCALLSYTRVPDLF
jgi:glutamate racemase